MDSAIKEKVLAVAGSGRNAAEWTAYFRVTLGLYYLAGLMTSDTIDFKKVDRAFNQFIYHTIGKGHTITSVLQFMSGAKVVPVVSSPRFAAAFSEHCPDVPSDTIPFLLQLNLGVAKNISGIDVAGPLLDWIERQSAPAPDTAQAEAAAGVRAPGDPAGPDVL